MNLFKKIKDSYMKSELSTSFSHYFLLEPILALFTITLLHNYGVISAGVDDILKNNTLILCLWIIHKAFGLISVIILYRIDELLELKDSTDHYEYTYTKGKPFFQMFFYFIGSLSLIYAIIVYKYHSKKIKSLRFNEV